MARADSHGFSANHGQGPAHRRIARSHPLLRADLKLATGAIKAGRLPFVTPVLGAADLADQRQLAGLAAGTMALGLALRNARLTRAGARMLIAGLVAISVARMGKHMFSRTRPTTLLSRGAHRFRIGGRDDHDHQSFPSAHAAGGVALARAFAREYPGYQAPGLTAAILAGVLKVLKGDHFPTDIIAGCAVGIAAEALTATAAPAKNRQHKAAPA